MLKALLQYFTTPVDPLIYNPLATATTPDDLIAAALVQSFVEDFDNWHEGENFNCKKEFVGENKAYWPNHDGRVQMGLLNKEKGPIIFGGLFHSKFENTPVAYCTMTYDDVEYQGVKLNPKASRHIYDSWMRISKAEKTAREVAAKAKKEMEDNEKKWNLAETLLGMKRNEHGALVPVVRVSD